MIKQFFKKLLISYLIIITFVFSPAVAYADSTTDKIDKLQIELQKRVGDRWTLSPRASKGAGVEIGVSQNYPVAVRTTATTAAGAATTNEAVVTAERVGSKIFTPTVANVAKRVAGGVVTNLIALALYDALKKSVDYVMDPANNRVIYHDGNYESNYVTVGCKTIGTCNINDAVIKIPYSENSVAQVCDQLGKSFGYPTATKFDGIQCAYNGYAAGSYSTAVKVNTDEKYMTYDDVAQRNIKLANNGNTTSQAGMQTVVKDMITNNEIDNSYFNDSSIQSDTYNDVTNNYITNNISNQYPSTKVASQGEMAAAAAKGQSSVTKTTQNANGSTTTTTTNFTTNNTTNNNTTNVYNITNVAVNNPAPEKDPPKKDDPPKASTPASTPTPTDSKFPAFCDWAKPVCDFIEWVKKEDDEPTELDIPNDVPTPTDTNIRFGGMCPPNADINVRIPFASLNFTLFDWSKWCYNLETFVKPVIILLAAYFSVLIFRGKNESS